ncbi:unnamed protein product [Cylicostephanus goldi]|uniref:Uncharacterized protein n=1 Tax=Cylicostephanus goldi TaxID=71465 RepID=A0A3P7PSZ5_CYLGO|nr:unnamed protein product [Cylicostephanus goldi]
MGMMMVDQGYNRPPELRPDPFLDDAQQPLYSEESSKLRVNRPRGSICGTREEREPKAIPWIFTVYAKSFVQLLMPWKYRKGHKVSKHRRSTDTNSAHKGNGTLHRSQKENQEDRV